MAQPNETLTAQTAALTATDRNATLEAARLALLVLLDNNQE